MKRVAIATLGCKVNQFESASFVSALQEAGCHMVPFSSSADVYLINTCTVTGRAGQQSRQLIRKAGRINPKARLVITGCYAQTSSQRILELTDNPVCIVGNGNKHKVVAAVLSEDKYDLEVLMGKISLQKEICELPVHHFSGRTRAYLKIQDGCNNFCSYCIVPFARGRSRSLKIDAVLRQVEVFIEEGYKELVVTGINVGKYGLDLDEGETIYSLLDRLCSQFSGLRIRLSSIEPTEVNDSLLELMVFHANFMPHLHIPLQSGDDEVLLRMNRNYTAEYFTKQINRLHNILKDAAIGIDVLVGFPGETNDAYKNTVQLLSGLPVTYLHVFPYSRHTGTTAALIKNQIPKKIKEQRVKILRKLDQNKRQNFYQNQLGSIHEVLVERRKKKNGLLHGFTDNYIPIQFQGDNSIMGTIAKVRIENIENGHPCGTLIA